MEIVIVIVSFLGGYFAQKIIDLILDKSHRLLKQKRVRRKILKMQIDMCDEKLPILPLAVGKPIFTSHDIDISVDSESKILLAFPKELLNELPASSGRFIDKDIIGNWFYLKGMSQEQFWQAIETARVKIATNFIRRTDSLYFNGERYGVSYVDAFSRTCDEAESPILTLKLYSTDHFTHKVIEEALHSLYPFKPEFSLENLNTQFKFIRTSLGVSIILILKSSNQIILTSRSKNASYAYGRNWIYVSATEAVTQTDYDTFISKPRLDLCVKRGLLEELGITENMYKADDIYFTDYFFETNFMQDGIVAVVNLNEQISFADVKAIARKAKDYELEVNELLLVGNKKQEIEEFVENRKKDMRDQTKFALKSYCARL